MSAKLHQIFNDLILSALLLHQRHHRAVVTDLKKRSYTEKVNFLFVLCFIEKKFLIRQPSGQRRNFFFLAVLCQPSSFNHSTTAPL